MHIPLLTKSRAVNKLESHLLFTIVRGFGKWHRFVDFLILRLCLSLLKHNENAHFLGFLISLFHRTPNSRKLEPDE